MEGGDKEKEKGKEKSVRNLLDDLEDLVGHDLEAGRALGEDVDLRVEVGNAPASMLP